MALVKLAAARDLVKVTRFGRSRLYCRPCTSTSCRYSPGRDYRQDNYHHSMLHN